MELLSGQHMRARMQKVPAKESRVESPLQSHRHNPAPVIEGRLGYPLQSHRNTPSSAVEGNMGSPVQSHRNNVASKSTLSLQDCEDTFDVKSIENRRVSDGKIIHEKAKQRRKKYALFSSTSSPTLSGNKEIVEYSVSDGGYSKHDRGLLGATCSQTGDGVVNKSTYPDPSGADTLSSPNAPSAFDGNNRMAMSSINASCGYINTRDNEVKLKERQEQTNSNRLFSLQATGPIPSKSLRSYSEFDISGERYDARFPWQRDIAIQCELLPGIIPHRNTDKTKNGFSSSENVCNQSTGPHDEVSLKDKSNLKKRPSLVIDDASTLRNSFDGSTAKTDNPGFVSASAHRRAMSGVHVHHRRSQSVKSPSSKSKRSPLVVEEDFGSVSDLELLLGRSHEDLGYHPSRYRADSLVSPPPDDPHCLRMFGTITPPGADLGERSDTLSSPRISPVPWQQSIPELVVTNAEHHARQRAKRGSNEKCPGNLLTVPSHHPQILRRSSSGSLQSISDESDTEPSPPLLRRGRRPALFDSKSLGLVSAPDDISPSNSCDEGDGTALSANERMGRKRSSGELGMNYPGDLLVRESFRRKKVLIKRNTIADFAATRSHQGSTASLVTDTDTKKLKGTFSLLKLIDKKTRSKDGLSGLEEILGTIKPSEFKDNHLICYKDVHWSELIASTDKERDTLSQSLSISETERKRREAVWELFKSECVFLIDHLMVLKHCFMEPIKKVQVEGHLMFAEPQDLFGNLDELCYVTYTFCRDFISLLLKDVSATEFGRTEVLIKAFQRFRQLSRDGEVYHNYCLNYSKAIIYLEQLRKNEEFTEFEKWCEQDSRCHRLQLTDLLISPMQHCTKVPLLLGNIRKYTEDPDEKTQLTESLEKLETSLKNLEVKMKWLKNFERVQEIQQQIIWQPITELDPRAFIPEFLKSSLSKQPCERLLASPKRQLLYEGNLTLLEISKTVEMYLFLFDDILLLTRIKKPPRKKVSVAEMNSMIPKSMTEGAVFVVHRQPIALDRFIIHDVQPPDAAGFWEYLECGVHASHDDTKEYPLLLEDEDANRPRANLFFGCLSAANGLKNAFVLVQISRFQQIIGVYTLQAPSDAIKSQWLNQLRDAQEKYKEACKKTSQGSNDAIPDDSLLPSAPSTPVRKSPSKSLNCANDLSMHSLITPAKSPSRSPPTPKARDARLSTLKALHEKSRSIDTIFI